MKDTKLNMLQKSLFILVSFLCFLKPLHATNDDLNEGQTAKAAIKAIMIPKAIEWGEHMGKGWGVALTVTVMKKLKALDETNIIRSFFGKTILGTSLSKAVPIAEGWGKSIGSFLAITGTIIIVDRYYIPWKHVVDCLMGGELTFGSVRQKDKSKLLESTIIAGIIGSFFCWDIFMRKTV